MLQLAIMKVESHVIVDQDATVNLYLDLVHTARHMLGVHLARRMRLRYQKRNFWLLVSPFYDGQMYNWDEVVTR